MCKKPEVASFPRNGNLTSSHGATYLFFAECTAPCSTSWGSGNEGPRTLSVTAPTLDLQSASASMSRNDADLLRRRHFGAAVTAQSLRRCLLKKEALSWIRILAPSKRSPTSSKSTISWRCRRSLISKLLTLCISDGELSSFLRSKSWPNRFNKCC